jgi:hypothetical protein
MGRLPDFVQVHAKQARSEASITELRNSSPRLGDWAQFSASGTPTIVAEKDFSFLP